VGGSAKYAVAGRTLVLLVSPSPVARSSLMCCSLVVPVSGAAPDCVTGGPPAPLPPQTNRTVGWKSEEGNLRHMEC